MATLNGQNINATYQALIKFLDNGASTTNLKALSDGVGEVLPIEISKNTDGIVKITGTLNLIDAIVTGLSSSDLSDVASLATVTYVDTEVGNEETARIAADNVLQGNIDTEEAARIAGDNNLQSQITSNDGQIATLIIDLNAAESAIDALEAGTGNVIGVRSNANAYIDGNVTLQQGANVTLSQTGSTITINSTGGGGTSGVTSLNTLTGILDIIQGTNISVATVGTDQIEISSPNTVTTTTFNTVTGALASSITDLENGVGNVTSFNTLTGDVTISGGTGITLTPSGNDIEIASTATSTTINNNAGGRIITGSNTANTLNAETGLTWVSNTLLVAGDAVLTGDVTAVEANVGTINYSKQITIQTPSTTFPAQGELSPIAGTGLTAGQLYYLNSSGVWTIADATTEASCKNMLGIAISATEVMIRGHLSYPAYAGFSDGEPLYVKPSAAGGITDIVPFTSGHIVRKIGFCLDGSVRSIYFNPSNDYFEVE